MPSMSELDLQVAPGWMNALRDAEAYVATQMGNRFKNLDTNADNFVKRKLSSREIDDINRDRSLMEGAPPATYEDLSGLVPNTTGVRPTNEGTGTEGEMNKMINNYTEGKGPFLREPTREEQNNINKTGTPLSYNAPNSMPPMGNLNKWLMLKRMTG